MLDHLGVPARGKETNMPLEETTANAPTRAPGPRRVRRAAVGTFVAPGGAPFTPPSGAGASQAPAEPTVGPAVFADGFTHGKVAVDGSVLHYVRGGSGPALVLLHGWP